MSARPFRIGTRPSPLALAQTHEVAAAVRQAHPGVSIEVVEITTTGDVDTRRFTEIGERGMFAAELELALLAGEIDCAVHSCKDLRLELPDGLVIAALRPREDPRDALCGDLRSLADLPPGATVATGSMRRSAALRLLRSDIVPHAIRGNVQTRLRVSAERGDAACMLAAAGLRRLGLAQHIALALPVADCVPEASQGAVAIQVCAEPHPAAGARPVIDWRLLADEPTEWTVAIERSVAAALGGGCEAPLGVHVDLRDGVATGYVFAAAADGSSPMITSCALDAAAPPEAVSDALLEHVGQQGIPQLLATPAGSSHP